MTKISAADRLRYLEKIKQYRQIIDKLLALEKETLVLIRKEREGAGIKRLGLAEDMLNLASNYIIMSNVSQAMLGFRNEDFLNEARKSIYKSVIYLEGTVSNCVDAPLSDYEDRLAEIAPVSAARRYFLIRKVGLTIQLLEDAYGDNSKWRWSFVELEGRFATVTKNIMDLKRAVVNTDPRSPEYEPTVYHLRLIKKLLAQAADRYREKYELSTNNIEDFKMGINFLSALRRIHSIVGGRDDVELTKKKVDIWTSKLEADVKKHTELWPKNTQDEDNGEEE
jgi:hypothetical protein